MASTLVRIEQILLVMICLKSSLILSMTSWININKRNLYLWEEDTYKIYFLYNYRLYVIGSLTLSFSIPVWSNTEFNLFHRIHDWIITCKYPKIYFLKFTPLVSYGLIFKMSASYKMLTHSTLCDSVIWPTGGCLEHHVASDICLQ